LRALFAASGCERKNRDALLFRRQPQGGPRGGFGQWREPCLGADPVPPGADGLLGGYAWGTSIKEELLRRERG
jgi:hypothetical protein